MPGSENTIQKATNLLSTSSSKPQLVAGKVENAANPLAKTSPSHSISSHKNRTAHSSFSHASSQVHSTSNSISSQAPKVAIFSSSVKSEKSGKSTETGNGMKKEESIAASDDPNQLSLVDLRLNQQGNRNSIMSDYSGIVQNVDIDTIKYVGNKESLHLSQLHDISSNSQTSLTSENFVDTSNNIGVSSTSLNQHLTQKGKEIFKIAENNHEDPIDPLEIPVRSIRRKMTKLDNDSILKVIKTKSDGSPNKQGISSQPPKSPLPKLEGRVQNTKSTSPLRGKHSRNNSTSSDASLKLHGRLDDIMKEVEDLKMEFQNEPPNNKRNVSNSAYSMSSTTNSVHTSTSFHTANSASLDEGSIADREFNDFVDEPTENLHIVQKTYNSNYSNGTSSSQANANEKSFPSVDGSSTIQQTEISTLRPKGSPSFKNEDKLSTPAQTIRTGKSSSHRSKSKRKSTSSKNKIRPFSYETLAKLLNATDGIIIGQEFATLNIPSEEKFLIEKIVDSISRLTANMMLNPARYDQSCARLEHVLNVLEGFD